jgi:hypothetical protein
MDKLTLDMFLHRRVVLDTPGPMIYIGQLEGHDERGYWLIDADVHDRSDGHSTKEVYVNQARELDKAGARNINRRRVFVERHAIISVSALDDVVMDAEPGEQEQWISPERD